MCNLYKAKKSFFTPLSSRVPSKHFSSNNPEILKTNNDLDTTTLWEKIGSEITELAEIIKDVENDSPD